MLLIPPPRLGGENGTSFLLFAAAAVGRQLFVDSNLAASGAYTRTSAMAGPW